MSHPGSRAQLRSHGYPALERCWAPPQARPRRPLAGENERPYGHPSENGLFGTHQLDRLWSWMKKFIPPQSKNRSKGFVNPRLWNRVYHAVHISPQRAKSWKAGKNDPSALFGGMSQHKMRISCRATYTNTGGPKGRETLFFLVRVCFPDSMRLAYIYSDL